MGEIVAFKSREPEEAHLSGMVRCMCCKHRWAAAIPIGAPAPYQCPNCMTMKGFLESHVSYADRCPSYQCVKCSSEIFTVFLNQDVPTLGCAECGELHNAMSLFP